MFTLDTKSSKNLNGSDIICKVKLLPVAPICSKIKLFRFRCGSYVYHQFNHSEKILESEVDCVK